VARILLISLDHVQRLGSAGAYLRRTSTSFHGPPAREKEGKIIARSNAGMEQDPRVRDFEHQYQLSSGRDYL